MRVIAASAANQCGDRAGPFHWQSRRGRAHAVRPRLASAHSERRTSSEQL